MIMSKFMRILVFFDLPVENSEKRKKYTKFRKYLLKDGYDMLQYSVYARICNGLDSVNKFMYRLENNIPEEGAIRAMIVTEKQYENMRILLGNKTQREKTVKSEQLLIF